MLHLAQVKKNPTSGERELQLLARQKSQYLWDVSYSQMSDSPIISSEAAIALGEGVLVLVELEENQKIVKIYEAKEWIISLIDNYLTNEVITPEWVEQEQERIEQWRQEMTAKSLDLTRRQLELETHTEQIQELETKLKQEREELESRWEKLKELEDES
jgi:hypothetical protein